MANLNLKEDHTYAHYNRALGKKIHSKAHYEYEMKKGGYIPYDEALDIAKDWDRNHRRKEYILSPGAMNIIKSLKATADKKGRIKLESRAISALKDIGVDFRIKIDVSKYSQSQGGFTNAK